MKTFEQTINEAISEAKSAMLEYREIKDRLFALNLKECDMSVWSATLDELNKAENKAKRLIRTACRILGYKVVVNDKDDTSIYHYEDALTRLAMKAQSIINILHDDFYTKSYLHLVTE